MKDDWRDQAFEIWLSRLSVAAENGGVPLSESDCLNLIAVLRHERSKRIESNARP